MTCDVTYSSSHSCGGGFVDLVGESFEEEDDESSISSCEDDDSSIEWYETGEI